MTQEQLNKIIDEINECDLILSSRNELFLGLFWNAITDEAPRLLCVFQAENNDNFEEILEEIKEKSDVPFQDIPPLVHRILRETEIGETVPQDLWNILAGIYADLPYEKSDKFPGSQKKLILQTVQCTGYLSRTRESFTLFHNPNDDNFYYEKLSTKDNFMGLATENISSWKHNQKYKFIENEFTGVIVKIDKILLSIMLGIDESRFHGILYPAVWHSREKDGVSILAATVYYGNGKKRLVPLDCIKEYKYFSDGKKTKTIMKNFDRLNSEDASKNLITSKEDGIIEIENTYCSMNPDTGELVDLKRYLELDVQNRTANCIAEKENEWFNISDEEYRQIMDIMNSRMKEECGFVPDLSYGETNFDRLKNFARFPFAPVLNELCNKEIFKERVNEIEAELKWRPDGVKKFIEFTGLTYTPKINKILLQGHRVFMEYLGIRCAVFSDENIIDKLINKDIHRLFASSIPDTKTEGFSYDVIFLFTLYDEKTVAIILTNSILSKWPYTNFPDCIDYMKEHSESGNLPQDVISKIGKEGFTDYNHDLLMRLYQTVHPAEEEHFENKEIAYSSEEKNLEWENAGYKFCLPENTNRLVDIGAKMNICVGHLYRDKAVKKECTIVYAQKDDVYKLCIEVSKHNNRFHLVQRSAFNNKAPQGECLKVFTKWCREKGVC